MPCNPVNQQPRTALPNPVIICASGLFSGQFVIEPHYAPHRKAAVSHVVDFSRRPFLHVAIDDEGPDLECVFAPSRPGRIAGLGIRHASGTAESNYMNLARRCVESGKTTGGKSENRNQCRERLTSLHKRTLLPKPVRPPPRAPRGTLCSRADVTPAPACRWEALLWWRRTAR